MAVLLLLSEFDNMSHESYFRLLFNESTSADCKLLLYEPLAPAPKCTEPDYTYGAPISLFGFYYCDVSDPEAPESKLVCCCLLVPPPCLELDKELTELIIEISLIRIFHYHLKL